MTAPHVRESFPRSMTVVRRPPAFRESSDPRHSPLNTSSYAARQAAAPKEPRPTLREVVRDLKPDLLPLLKTDLPESHTFLRTLHFIAATHSVACAGISLLGTAMLVQGLVTLEPQTIANGTALGAGFAMCAIGFYHAARLLKLRVTNARTGSKAAGDEALHDKLGARSERLIPDSKS